MFAGANGLLTPECAAGSRTGRVDAAIFDHAERQCRASRNRKTEGDRVRHTTG